MAKKRSGRKKAARTTSSGVVAESVREALARDAGGADERRTEAFLFPLKLRQLERVAGGAHEGMDTGTYSEILETICGTADDSQEVEQYDGTLGVTVAFVNANQGPVGQLQWNDNLAAIYSNPGNVSGERWATGTLLDNNLFLTAGHNFDQTGGGWTRPRQNGTFNTIPPAEIATNMHVNFNFQLDPNGVQRPEQQFPVIALVEYRLGGLDFAIARLGGNPAATFGTARISAANATQGESICIIGHPMGLPKRIEAGTVFSISGTQLLYDNIDTLGGNSGSGILRASNGRVVGVHTNGGCNTAGTGQNRGFPIAEIIATSPTLQGLLANTTTVVADIATNVAADVTGTLASSDLTTAAADNPTTVVADVLATSVSADRTNVLADFTTTVLDAPGTSLLADAATTRKSLDDAKGPALDKQFSDVKLPASDAFGVDPFGPLVQPGGIGGAVRPFVLANPHHAASALGGEFGAQAQTPQAQFEMAIAQIEQLLQRGQGELSALQEQHRRLVAEYREMMGGLQQP
jgi:V8-like Glu-specific endopeptidase